METNVWPQDVSVFRSDAGLRGIVSGVGSLRAELGPTLAALGANRPLLVCGAHVAQSTAFAIAHRALHDTYGRDPLVYAGSVPHSPAACIETGAGVARTHDVDAIVAVGGSSTIDTAKGMAVLLATGEREVAALRAPSVGGLSAPMATPAGAARFPVLCATTTLSYAEFYPFWGTRRADNGAKAGYGDHGVVSRTIFLDGELAACTPDDVWFETAIKSFDDALLLWVRSGGYEPFLDPLLLEGLRGVRQHLAASSAAVHDVASLAARRQTVLLAMALTKYPAPRTQVGFASEWFARGVRYALGSLYGFAHGVGTCVAMTEGLRFHAPGTAQRQAQLAYALGVAPPDATPDDAVGALYGSLEALTARLGLPRSLDQLGISDVQIRDIIDHLVATMPGLGSHDVVAAAIERLRREPGEVSSRV